MFELSQLRCFIALAQELHFGRAAERLNMTQSPLSRQLQQLEHILGVTLIERSNRVVRLTVGGKMFLADAQNIVRSAEEALLSIRKVGSGEGGVITLGFIPITSYKILPQLVAFLSEEMPHVQLVLKEMVTADQVEACRTGRIDFGILRTPIDTRGFETACISREPFLIALPTNHPFNARQNLKIKDLDRQPFIMYAPIESSYHYNIIASLFQVGGVAPVYVQYTREIHTMLSLVGAGIGLALVPESATHLGFAGVGLKPISSTPAVFSELTVVWRNNSDNPAVRMFTRDLLPRFLERGGGVRV